MRRDPLLEAAIAAAARYAESLGDSPSAYQAWLVAFTLSSWREADFKKFLDAQRLETALTH